MSRIEEEMGDQDGGSEEDGEDGDRKGKAERGERRGEVQVVSPYGEK